MRSLTKCAVSVNMQFIIEPTEVDISFSRDYRVYNSKWFKSWVHHLFSVRHHIKTYLNTY